MIFSFLPTLTCFYRFYLSLNERKNQLISVFFIGSGRIAAHLAEAFSKTDIELKGVHSKTPTHAQIFADKFQIPFFENIQQIPKDADVYILAVNDDQIEVVSSQISVNGIVTHCSGLKDINSIQGSENKAVMWPLQSFSKDKKLNFKEIPILLEANSDENYRIIEALSERISHKLIECSSEKRKYYHLAAVFVNNFSNHLFVQAEEILSQQNLNYKLLLPLMIESIEKLNYLSPKEAQTGPAARGDESTMKNHLDLLSENKTAKDIYSLISHSIQNHQNK
jgi:predicted short-subunit dehydrogenase-like oxidoreductase (DUF2520 family)